MRAPPKKDIKVVSYGGADIVFDGAPTQRYLDKAKKHMEDLSEDLRRQVQLKVHLAFWDHVYKDDPPKV